MTPRHGTRRTSLLTGVCSLLILASSLPSSARADEPSPPSPWRDTLWITGTGALLSATLSGVFALKAGALSDRAQGLLSDAPELPELTRDAGQARALAVGFGVGAVLFTAASVLLLVEGPSLLAAQSGKDSTATLSPIVGPSAAGLCWRGRLP